MYVSLSELRSTFTTFSLSKSAFKMMDCYQLLRKCSERFNCSTQQQKKPHRPEIFLTLSRSKENCAKMVIYPFSLYYSPQLSCCKLFSLRREAEILIVVPPTERRVHSSKNLIDFLSLSSSVWQSVCCLFFKKKIGIFVRREAALTCVKKKSAKKQIIFEYSSRWYTNFFGEWEWNGMMGNILLRMYLNGDTDCD